MATGCFEMSRADRPQGYRIADESLLDDASRALIDQIELSDAPHYTAMTPAELRAGHADFFAALDLKEKGLASVEKINIARSDGSLMSAWIYRPIGTEAVNPLPVMLYCHGGGMMVGSLETYDAMTKRMCAKSGVAIVSIDYRLTPEHRYPSAHEDCFHAIRWLVERAGSLGLDGTRLAIGGDSGGGLLSASAARLSAKGDLPPILFQLLIYPFLGRRHDYASYVEFQDGYFGSSRQLDWFIANYLNFPDELNSPTFSAILDDNFVGLPPTFIATAGYDMLRDEAEDYGRLLQAAGGMVEIRRYASTFHPFFNAAGVIPAGCEAIDACAQALARAVS